MCYPKFQATHTSSYKKNKNLHNLTIWNQAGWLFDLPIFAKSRDLWRGQRSSSQKKQGPLQENWLFFPVLSSQVTSLSTHKLDPKQLPPHKKTKKTPSSVNDWILRTKAMLYRFIEIPWIFKKVAFQVARFFHFYQFKALGIFFSFYVDSNKFCALSA